MRTKAFLAVFVFLALLAGCKSPAPAQRRYPLRGEIVSADPGTATVTVHHEDIPGLMKSMTMPFPVKDKSLFDMMKPGQHIDATLVIENYHSWLEDVKTSGPEESEKALSPETSQHFPTKGDSIPDFVFLNQDGKRVHLAQYRGKVVVLTFIYTRCPLPDFCPRMTRNFQTLEKSLKQDPALYSQTHLLMVTNDPLFDTPRVMRAYALQTAISDTKTPFEHWEFLTPREADLKQITGTLGLSQWKEDGQLVHSLSTVVFGKDGKIYSWHHGNDWTPEEISQEMKAAQNQP